MQLAEDRKSSLPHFSMSKRFADVASLPPDFEIAPEWDVCFASIMRPAAQERIKKLMEAFTSRVMWKNAWDITSANSGRNRRQPSESGPYTIRVKLPRGVKLMPDRHPEDRIYTAFPASSRSAWATGSIRRSWRRMRPVA